MQFTLPKKVILFMVLGSIFSASAQISGGLPPISPSLPASPPVPPRVSDNPMVQPSIQNSPAPQPRIDPTGKTPKDLSTQTPIALSDLNAAEKQSIEAVCSTDKYRNGPAAYNQCLNLQLRKLR